MSKPKQKYYLIIAPDYTKGWELETFNSRKGLENRLTEVVKWGKPMYIVKGTALDYKVISVEVLAVDDE